MRKVRDFDAELKALNDRAKLLKQRKIQQFGELIEATGADAMEPDLLAEPAILAPRWWQQHERRSKRGRRGTVLRRRGHGQIRGHGLWPDANARGT